MARLRKYEILLKSFSLGDILVETYNTRSFNDSDFSAVFFFSKGDLAPTRAGLRWPRSNGIFVSWRTARGFIFRATASNRVFKEVLEEDFTPRPSCKVLSSNTICNSRKL